MKKNISGCISLNAGLLFAIIFIISSIAHSQENTAKSIAIDLDIQPWDIRGNNTNTSPGSFLGTLNAADLVFKTNARANPNASERMRITSTGKTGIGTTTPNYSLHLHSEDLFSSAVQKYSNRDSLNFDSTGKATPFGTGPVDFYGRTVFQITNKKSGITQNSGLLLESRNQDGMIDLQGAQGVLSVLSHNGMAIATANNRLSLTALHGDMMLRANKFFFANNSNQTRLFINVDGKIGVGTLAPREQLSVAGKIFVGADPAIYPKMSYYTVIAERSIDSYNSGGRNAPLLLNYNTQSTVNVGNPALVDDVTLEVAGVTSSRKVIIGGKSILSGNPHDDFLLAVNGSLVAKSAWVTLTGWGDYVFTKEYARMNWQDKKRFFDKNMHLPGMPSASEVEKNGIDVGNALKTVTINVEENSLDIVDLYQRLEKLEKENNQLKNEISGLKRK